MLFKSLNEEIVSIRRRDPAAQSWIEVLLCYPGLHALIFFRLSSWLWRHGWTIAGRWVSQLGKVLTAGIEIHPGATIGKRLFIDHGTGVVIGETAVIGDDVTLYHGVTLGGTSLHRGKRHPTLEDGVIVGSGAQILGDITVGANARVGANAVVLADVPPDVTVVGIPARIAQRREHNVDCAFAAYGLSDESIPDPVARVIETLCGQINALSTRIAELEAERDISGTDAARASFDPVAFGEPSSLPTDSKDTQP